MTQQRLFDPLATKGSKYRDVKGQYQGVGTYSPRMKPPFQYSPTKVRKNTSNPYGYGGPKAPGKKFIRPSTPKPRTLKTAPKVGFVGDLPGSKPFGTRMSGVGRISIPGIRGLRGLGGFLRGAQILGSVFDIADGIAGMMPYAGQTPWIWLNSPNQQAVYCGWWADGPQRAIDHASPTFVTAVFNCGIFEFPDVNTLPGPVIPFGYELWYYPFGMLNSHASLVQVFNLGGDPIPNVGYVGPIEASAYQDPQAIAQFSPGFPNGGGVAGFGPPDDKPKPFPGHYNHSPHMGPRHFDRPPRRGDVETKGKVPLSTFQRVIKGLANMTSESADFIGALYGALPRWARTDRSGTIQGEAQAVYTYLAGGGDPGYVGRAVKGIIQNEVGDRIGGVIGRAGKAAVQGNPYWRRPVGLQAGGRYTPWNLIGSVEGG